MYYVNYRLGNESVKVMDYNMATETFTATDKAAGRFEITGGAIIINGVTAMTCVGGEATIPTLTHRGAPKKANVPLVEFVRKTTSIPVVVASLSNEGVLYVDRVNEADLPDTLDQMKIGGCSFSQNGLTAVTIVEEDL